MKLFQRRPILAFSLICITINIYCASGGKITPPHVINVREGMGSSSDESSPIPTLSAVPWGQLSPRADDLGEFPDDDSDMEPLTEHQLAQRYLAHFSGNTTAAMPHLVKVFEQNAQAKHGLERFMQKTTRGGIQPLFVKVRELIHAQTPRVPTTRGKDFLSGLSEAMPIAHEVIDPVVQALTNTSETLATTEQDKAALVTENKAVKANSNYKAAAWTAVGSLASLLLSAGLTMVSSYVGSLTPAGVPETIQCTCVWAVNATLGG